MFTCYSNDNNEILHDQVTPNLDKTLQGAISSFFFSFSFHDMLRAI